MSRRRLWLYTRGALLLSGIFMLWGGYGKLGKRKKYGGFFHKNKLFFEIKNGPKV